MYTFLSISDAVFRSLMQEIEIAQSGNSSDMFHAQKSSGDLTNSVELTALQVLQKCSIC
jgi:hydroxypyruvate isomerase